MRACLRMASNMVRVSYISQTEILMRACTRMEKSMYRV